MLDNEDCNIGTPDDNRQSNQKSNIKGYMALTLAISLLIALVMGINYYSNKKFDSNMVMAEKCFGEDKIDEAVEYYSRALSYKQDDAINEKLALCKNIIASKNQYNNAVEYFSIMSYLSAYNSFRLVIPEDIKRFNIAQTKMVESKELYLESQFNTGNDSYMRNDYGGAVKAMRSILAIDNGNERAIQLLSLYEIPLKEQEDAREAAEALAQKQEAEAAKTKVKSEGVRIGMTQQQVMNSSWGRPKDINRTTTAYGVHEQWIYNNYNCLYFEDGILTAIQN